MMVRPPHLFATERFKALAVCMNQTVVRLGARAGDNAESLTSVNFVSDTLAILDLDGINRFLSESTGRTSV